MLRLLQTPHPVSDPETIAITVDGEAVGVRLRRHATARRLTLRIPPGEADPILTLPPTASRRAAERFVRQNAGWLHRQLAARVPGQPFADGAVIPVRGEPHRISHVAGARGTVWIAPADVDALPEPRLMVAGEPDHIHRRVGDALRKWARQDILEAVEGLAATVGKRPSAIRIKDTRSQWGSCTSRGVLSFSWRLVLAPPMVLRYVAAHEVAHLVHMDHGRDFWRLNAALAPDMEVARHWLKVHGRGLHAVGASRPPG